MYFPPDKVFYDLTSASASSILLWTVCFSHVNLANLGFPEVANIAFAYLYRLNTGATSPSINTLRAGQKNSDQGDK